MLAKWNTKPKIEIAKNVLVHVLDSLKNFDDVEIALRVFGHQKPVPPQDCNDTKLEVPFKKNNHEEIKEFIKNIQPKGTTPIAKSLEYAANDFPKASKSRNIIILITDGIEACDDDPCAISEKLQKEGIILKPFIIGIGLDPDLRKSFGCVGNYYDAESEIKFKEVLSIVINQALNKTSLQINLLDATKKPTETNLPIIFYDKNLKKIRYSYIHTLTALGLPDTLIVDPYSEYKITVFTLPSVYIDSVRLTPGKHITVGTYAAQGFLKFDVNPQMYKDVYCIVRKNKNSDIITFFKITETKKFLSGDYYLDILTLPPLKLDVNIKPHHTTTIKLPDLCILTLFLPSNGYGAIFLEKNDELQWVTDLKENVQNQTFLLLPGEYRVIWRPKKAYSSLQTIEKRFILEQNSSIRIDLR